LFVRSHCKAEPASQNFAKPFISEIVDALYQASWLSMLSMTIGGASRLPTSFRWHTRDIGFLMASVTRSPFRQLTSLQEPSIRFRMACYWMQLSTYSSTATMYRSAQTYVLQAHNGFSRADDFFRIITRLSASVVIARASPGNTLISSLSTIHNDQSMNFSAGTTNKQS
jgi:hypothetical protein